MDGDTSLTAAVEALRAHDANPDNTARQDLSTNEPDTQDQDEGNGTEADPQEPLDTDEEWYQDTTQAEGEESEANPEPDAEAAKPIDPPVSWDAEQKAWFATLPPERQQKLATRESEREQYAQSKATEAAENRKAFQSAAEVNTQLHRHYAEQLETYAKAFEPPELDYSLAETNPGLFVQQMAQREAVLAQRNAFAQQAAQARQSAENIEQQHAAVQHHEEMARLKEAIPEWADDTKRGAMLSEFEQVGRALGYPDELLAQARAVDIIGLKTASSWKAKADKYDALMGQRMEGVRAAKQAPKVSIPGTAQPRGSAQAQRHQQSMQRLAQSGSLEDAVAAFKNRR